MAVVEAANMRHLPNQEPTWKSYGLHKLCKWLDHNCGCPRGQRHSCIDNAYVSLDATVSLRVLEDAITDHYPFGTIWSISSRILPSIGPGPKNFVIL